MQHISINFGSLLNAMQVMCNSILLTLEALLNLLKK